MSSTLPLSSIHNHFFFLTAPPLRSELPGQLTFEGCHWRTGFWSVASSPVDSGVGTPSIPLTPGGAQGAAAHVRRGMGSWRIRPGRMRAPGGRCAGGVVGAGAAGGPSCYLRARTAPAPTLLAS
jgi:hypothetical protein